MTIPARRRHTREIRRVPRRRHPIKPFRERHAVLPRKVRRGMPARPFSLTFGRLKERWSTAKAAKKKIFFIGTNGLTVKYAEYMIKALTMEKMDDLHMITLTPSDDTALWKKKATILDEGNRELEIINSEMGILLKALKAAKGSLEDVAKIMTQLDLLNKSSEKTMRKINASFLGMKEE